MTNPTPITSIPMDDDDSFLEEELSYNFRELMDMLIDKRDIIITVPTDQVAILKKGLYARKGKDTYKLRRAGVNAGNDVLSFLTYLPKDIASGMEDTTQTCVRVKLGARKSVNVISIEVPDDEL